MPLHIIPRRIFAHRVACKALYRACLTQCPRISAPDDVQSQGPVPLLKHLIRKGFKKNIHVTSPRLVVQELKRGYAAEELLRNAAKGNQAAILQIHDLLRLTAHESHLSRIANVQPPRLLSTPHNKTIPAPFPGAPQVLDIRPLPKEKLTGRRRVPTLTTCGGWIPFLRFKKPQSRFLGRVMRDKLAQKQGRWERIEKADGAIEVGEAEGEWELRVARQARKEIALAEEREEMGKGVEEREKERIEKMQKWLEEGEGKEFGESKERFFFKGGKGEANGEEGRRSIWAAEAARQKYELWEAVNAENEKAMETGKRMLEIVEKERELWAKERQERKDVKRTKRGKGPGGRPGSGEQKPVAEKLVSWKGFKEWETVDSQHNEPKVLSTRDFKLAPGRTGTARSLEWGKWEPRVLIPRRGQKRI